LGLIYKLFADPLCIKLSKISKQKTNFNRWEHLKQDVDEAWDLDDMRIALRLDKKVKLLSCVATERKAVKSVLLELLYSILAEMEEETK